MSETKLRVLGLSLGEGTDGPKGGWPEVNIEVVFYAENGSATDREAIKELVKTEMDWLAEELMERTFDPA